MEQQAFLQKKLGSAGLCLLYTFCQHHQAALTKKPIILKLTGLATGLVTGVVVNSRSLVYLVESRLLIKTFFSDHISYDSRNKAEPSLSFKKLLT